ncbi:MAG: outer membrane beta-barrel protein [Balneolaceae bacterium]|nr:outer membrane beta-barrel protein [Balneolaceae bacterium]
MSKLPSSDKAIAGIFAFCILLLFSAESAAQIQYANTEYSRFSLSFQGGVTLGYPDDVNQFFGSNYNTFTQPTYNLGGELHYSISPFWSTALGYRYNSVNGVGDDGFETRIHSVVFKNLLNLNRIFRRNIASEWINPYLILGLEHDFFRYELDNVQNTGNESAILGGFGLSARINNRVELFSQYEVKFSNNKLDNMNQGYPFDQVGMVTGGIRIRLGNKRAKPLRLAPPVKFLTDAEYEDFLTRSDQFFAANEEIKSQRRKLDELEATFAENDRYYNQRIDEQMAFSLILEERINGLDERVTRLENRVDNANIIVEREEESLRREVPAGHYVQIFASRQFESAVQVRDQFHDLIASEVDTPGEKVFVIQRGNYYEVLIGTFYRFEDASNVHAIALTQFDDAFVISFPRPLHLEDAYQGTEIVWDTQSISSLKR